MSHATYEEQMMTEALTEHDNGCCTQNAPCIVRTGVTRALASHKLTPDFIVREEKIQAGTEGLSDGSSASLLAVSALPAQGTWSDRTRGRE